MLIPSKISPQNWHSPASRTLSDRYLFDQHAESALGGQQVSGQS